MKENKSNAFANALYTIGSLSILFAMVMLMLTGCNFDCATSAWATLLLFTAIPVWIAGAGIIANNRPQIKNLKKPIRMDRRETNSYEFKKSIEKSGQRCDELCFNYKRNAVSNFDTVGVRRFRICKPCPYLDNRVSRLDNFSVGGDVFKAS